MSDDQEEAGAGMAVCNACYNTPERLAALNAAVSCETLCTDGLSLAGLTIGMIGRMSRTARNLSGAKKVYIFELSPKDGDLPASEEERLVPQCDILIVTGTSILNHTLPHLLELAAGARIILLGPSVPLLPELHGAGISRLSGLVITRRRDFFSWNRDSVGSPMPYGESFLLKQQ